MLDRILFALLASLAGNATFAADSPHTVVLLGSDQVQTVAWVADGRMIHHIGEKPPKGDLSAAAGLHVRVESAVFNGTQALAEAYLRDKSDIHHVAVQLATYLAVVDRLRSTRSGVVAVAAHPQREQPRQMVIKDHTPPSTATAPTDPLALAGQLLALQADRNTRLAVEQERRLELDDAQTAALAQQRQADFTRQLAQTTVQRQQDSDRLLAFLEREQTALSASLQHGRQQMQQAEAESALAWRERLKQPLMHESLMGKLEDEQRQIKQAVKEAVSSVVGGSAGAAVAKGISLKVAHNPVTGKS